MNTAPSRFERIRENFLNWTSPHSSIKDIGEIGRVRLLNSISLVLTILLVLGLAAAPTSVITFEVLLVLSIISFVLGKTRFARFGLVVFSAGFVLVSFIAIYYGATSDASSVILSIVPIALIIANVLTSRNVFAGLAILAVLASFLSPQYAGEGVVVEGIIRTGGIIMTIGAILFALSVFRTDLEDKRLAEVVASNRELEQIKTTLEERVSERTALIEKSSAQFQIRAAAFQNLSEISGMLANNAGSSLQNLMNLITESISNSFGYYHTGIFLLDENREFAILQAANSAGGKRMLARQHQLRVGGTGVVGYAAQSGYIRTALNTGADAVFFNNPDLPETRSEIALPLKVGGRILGVLDVQSTQPSAFDDDDIVILETLANQVALALQGAILRDNPAFSDSRNTWGGQRSQIAGFSYRSDGSVVAAEPADKAKLQKVISSGEVVMPVPGSNDQPGLLIVPVKFRDQVIGVLNIQPEDTKRRWNDDEILMMQAIAERAALALENARLLEETTRRAEQEHVIADITTRIGSSNRIDNILQTTIQELGRLLGSSRTYVQFTSTQNESGNQTEERN